MRVILQREMRSEEAESGEVHPPRTHGLDERGQRPRRARDEDAVVRGTFRKAESRVQKVNIEENARSR